VLEGNVARGRAAVAAALQEAQTIGPVSLRARCAIFLARIDIKRRQFAAAAHVLDGIEPDEGGRVLDRELRAQQHYWRAQIYLAQRDRAAAEAEISVARKLLGEVRDRLTAPNRRGFETRADLQAILG
jgi:hypothetical protein